MTVVPYTASARTIERGVNTPSQEELSIPDQFGGRRRTYVKLTRELKKKITREFWVSRKGISHCSGYFPNCFVI